MPKDIISQCIHLRQRGPLVLISLWVAAALGVGACAADSPADPNEPAVDVELTVAAGQSSVNEGAVVGFTASLVNNSARRAGRVEVGDSLSSGLTYEAHTASAGTYNPATRRWVISDFDALASAQLTVTARAAAGTSGEEEGYGALLLSSEARDSTPGNNGGVATVGVQPPGPPVVIESDWSTATGNTREAITDGGVWNRLIECGGTVFNVMNVVQGTTVGWTSTPNVLRIQQRGSTECGNVERTENTIAPSTSHWGRFYFRNDEASTSHFHPVSYNCCGTIQLVPWARFGSASGVKIGVGTYRNASNQTVNYPFNMFFPGAAPGAGVTLLQNGVWYRYEWHVEYLTATAVRIRPRIYDMDGDLLFDESSFYQNDNVGAGALSLQQWYAAGNALGVTDVNLAKNFGLGNEGPGGSANTGGSWYIARVALSTAGWVGQ